MEGTITAHSWARTGAIATFSGLIRIRLGCRVTASVRVIFKFWLGTAPTSPLSFFGISVDCGACQSRAPAIRVRLRFRVRVRVGVRASYRVKGGHYFLQLHTPFL